MAELLLSNKNAPSPYTRARVIYRGDGSDLEKTTHLSFFAHPDDAPLGAAMRGISLMREGSAEYTSVITTDGSCGKARGDFEGVNPRELAKIREAEAIEEASIGNYLAQILLAYPSHPSDNTVEFGNHTIATDYRRILVKTQPEVVYIHNPIDIHDHHIVSLYHAINAIRQISKSKRPKEVWGCEVSVSLDVLQHNNGALGVFEYDHKLQRVLERAHKSQLMIRQYDMMAIGKAMASAVSMARLYGEDKEIDNPRYVVVGLDMMPLIRDPDLTITAFFNRIWKAAGDGYRARFQGH